MKHFVFGPIHVDTQQRVVYNGNELLVLPPKAVEILLVLVANPGQVISRETLRQKVWPDAFIEDANLSNNVSLLRAAIRPILAGEDPIRTIPKRGYQFIAPVSESDIAPDDLTDATDLKDAARPEAADLASAPEDPPPATTQTPTAAAAPTAVGQAQDPPAAKAAFRFGRLPAAATLILLTLMLAAGVATRAYIRNRNRVSAAQAVSRPSLAIMNFKNLSDQPAQDWLGTAIQETIGSDLAHSNRVRLVSGLRTAEAERDLQLAPKRSYDNALIQQLGRRLDCGLALTGSYLLMGDTLRLDIQIRNTATGAVVSDFSTTARQTDMMQAVTNAGSTIRSALGVLPAPGSQPSALPALGTSEDAMRFYAEGLKLLRDGKPLEAQPLLSKAILASPQSPQVHAAAAEAWDQLGISDKAEPEAKQALQLAATLPKEERLGLQAQSYRILRDWPNARKAYTELHTENPDDLDAVLGLSKALLESNQEQLAMQVLLDEVRSSPSIAGDPRLSDAEAEVALQTADWRNMLLYSGEEIRLAHAMSASVLEADGYLHEGCAWYSLGDLDHAMADFRKAEQISSATADNRNLAEAIDWEGTVKWAQGDQRAVATFRRSLEIYTTIGALRATFAPWMDLGNALDTAGDRSGARVAYQHAIDVATADHSPRHLTTAYVNLASLCLEEHDYACASSKSQVAMKAAQDAGDLDSETYALDSMADSEIAVGSRTQARADLRQALQIAEGLGDPSRKARILLSLADLEKGAGNLGLAHQLSDNVNALHALAADDAAQELTFDAELHLAEGRPDLVEAPMTALTKSSTTASPAVNAWRLLAESWLVRGQIAKARTCINRADALAHQLPGGDAYQPDVSLLAARVDAAEGHPANALAALSPLLQKAKTKNDLELQLEIRQAQGEIQARSGNLRDATLTLKTLEANADKYSFGLIAQQARFDEAHSLGSLQAQAAASK